MRAMSEASIPSGADAPWRAAATFADLCALGARFVSGGLERFPGWGAPALDVESDALVPALVGLNRAGFLTLASQPGRIGRDPDGVRVRQRAFVFGFVSDDIAARLGAPPPAPGLALRVFRPGDGADAEALPVSERDGVAHAFAGVPAFAEELALFAEDCGPAALAALARATFASAIDLEWGRERALWSFLARALAGLDARA